MTTPGNDVPANDVRLDDAEGRAAEAEATVRVQPAGDPMLPPEGGVAPPLPPVRLKALGGSALLFSSATIISSLVSVLMLPLYTRFLTPADYGAIELVEQSLDFLTIVAGSRLLGGVFRFYFKTNSEDERRAVISTAIWTVCGGYAIIGLLAFVAAPLLAHTVLGADKYTGLVRLGALSVATSAATFVPTPYFRAKGRFRFIVGTQLGRLAIQVVLNVVLLTVFHLQAAAIFISTIVANTCLGSLLVFITVRDVGGRYVRRIAGDLYRFGFPLVLTQVATFVLTFGDRYFLRRATTLGAVGRYTLSYQFAFLLAKLAQAPFEMVWDPKRHEIAKRPDRDAVYARMFMYENIALLSGAVAIALFARSALQLLTPTSYWEAADVLPALLPAILLQAWSAAHDIGVVISERTKWIAIGNWLGAGAVLAAYALLIPPYAAWGAAIATAIGYAVRYLTIYTKSQELWPVRYNWPPVWRLVALSAATVGVGIVMPSGPLFVAILSRIGLFGLYVWLMWTLPILDDDERQAIRRMVADVLDSAATRLKRQSAERVAP